MEAHIQKWGNSLGLRIPMALAKRLNFRPGTNVIIEVENGRLVIQSPTSVIKFVLWIGALER